MKPLINRVVCADVLALSTERPKRANGVDLSSIQSVGRSLCVCIRKVYCGKTADWIRMPFGMGSGFGRGMGELDWAGDRRGEGAVLG